MNEIEGKKNHKWTIYLLMEMIVKMNMQTVMKWFNVFALRKLLSKDH